MRMFSPTLITDEWEIDLYEAMKYDQVRSDGQIRAYLPPPRYGYVYVQLTRTKQRHGWRIWFLCPRCKRRTSKLYYLGVVPNRIACRICRELKYPSQYKKDAFSKSMMNRRKLERLQKQERRLWYGGYLTRYGVQYQKLAEECEMLNEAIIAESQLLQMQAAMERASFE